MPRTVEFDESVAIQKAMEVFWKKGYNATSLRDLTEVMQINSSSLYNSIGDKQELFVRCVTHYTEIRKKDLQKRLNTTDPAIKILIRFINDSVDVILHGSESCMAVKSAFEVGGSDRRVKQILKADSDNTYKFIHNLLSKAIAQGEISGEEDPEMLADYFISTWIGWNESYILHKDADKIRKMARYFIRHLSK